MISTTGPSVPSEITLRSPGFMSALAVASAASSACLVGFGLPPFGVALPALDAGIGDPRGHQADGPDGVVVAGDHVVDVVRIAVGVHDGHDGDAQPAPSRTAMALVLGVDDEHRPGRRVMSRMPPSVAVELDPLLAQLEALLLGKHAD
jgi:hypothetical protein